MGEPEADLGRSYKVVWLGANVKAGVWRRGKWWRGIGVKNAPKIARKSLKIDGLSLDFVKK
ncbi:hypothetical protein HUU59_08300 [bacterium]|nr:hypothetical protein [bacterium]